MDIKVEEKDDLISVYVKIPKYNTRIKRKTIINTNYVQSQVEAQGYSPGEAVQTSYLHNLNGITEGTWIFKKKILDKPEENVILEEEKPVQPKPKRPRRTRSSTKKVSTED